MQRHFLLLALVAAVAAACNRTEPTAQPSPQTLVVTGDTTVGTGTATELRGWRDRWRATRAGRDYTFTLRRSCFCGEEWRRPVVVRVEGDRVVSVKDAETGEARPIDRWQGPSIEMLYAQAIGYAAEQPRPVTYAAAGFPVMITVGPVESDGGSWYFLSAVTFGS